MTFIKVGLDKMLILTIGNKKTLYTETISLAKRYDSQIKKQIELINMDIRLISKI